MAEEEVLAPATSPASLDHKRKLQDLDAEAPPPNNPASEPPADSGDAANGAADVADAASPEAKRPKLDETKSDALVTANGSDGEKLEGHAEEDSKEPCDDADNKEAEAEDAAHPPLEGVTETISKEEASAGDNNPSDAKNASVEEANNDETEGKHDTEKQLDGEIGTEKQYQEAEDPEYDDKSTSRKIEVPNDKVGVLIGKGGETIRYLQINSGARIQITRDAESDPQSTTRPVELIGTPSSINQAEKLIIAVIAEAEAGGSPALVARGLPISQAAAVADQFEMQVPNEKVGLIIGRGGETIKALQTRSGARIQLIPQHPPEGDGSKERIVRVSGNKRQIEIARDMIKDVMSQNVRQSNYSGGSGQQQSYRSRGPTGPSWGPRGPHSSQPMPYDYHHRGPYPSHQSPHYPPPSYSGYPQQQMGARGNISSGWEQRLPPSMQGPGPHGAGPSPMGHPPSQSNYNYGPPHGPDYGHQGTYSQSAPPPQSYGAQQPSYGIPPRGPQPQAYGPPRPSQPAEVPYQGAVPSSQTYGSGVPPQQQYPYPSSGPTQQSYPTYGSTATDGYPQQGSQPVQTYGQQGTGYVQGPSGGYGSYPAPQQGGYMEQQPAPANAGYGYQGSQDPSAAYGSVPASGYSAPSSVPGSGYSAPSSVPSSGYSAPSSVPGSGYSAPSSGQQPSYGQPAATQASYEQPVAQPAAYGATAQAGYGKTVSPQPGYPQYEAAAQMYVTPR